MLLVTWARSVDHVRGRRLAHRGVVDSIPGHNLLAKLLLHAASGATAAIHRIVAGLAESTAARAGRIVPLMLRNIDLGARLPIQQVVAIVAQRVDVLATHHAAYFRVVVFLGEVLALLALLVLKVEDVEGGSTLVGVTDLVLGALLFDFLILTLLLFFHELPAFQITLILGNSF